MSFTPIEGPIPPVFPGNIKQFPIFSDYTTIDYAANDNAQNSEITAIEECLGVNPQGPFPTVAAFLLNLYAGAKPLAHTHAHDPTAPDGMALTDLGSDTHTQYPRVDGQRGFSAPVPGVDPITPPHLSTKRYTDNRDAYNLQISEQYAYSQAQAAIQTSEAYTDAAIFNRLIISAEQSGATYQIGGAGYHEEFVTYFSNYTLQGTAMQPYSTWMGPLKAQSGVIEAVIDPFSGCQIPVEGFKYYIQSCVATLAWISPADPRLADYPGIPVFNILQGFAPLWDLDPRPSGMGNINILFQYAGGASPVGQLVRFSYTVIGV